MGYNQYCAGKFNNKFFQPCNSINIQVVCRFVQQDNTWFAEKGFCQQNFNLVTTFQVFHLHIVVFFIHTQTVEQLQNFGFCFPAVQFGKFAFKLCSAFTIFFRKVRFCIKFVFFFHNFIQSRVAHNNCFHYIIFVELEMVLFQN